MSDSTDLDMILFAAMVGLPIVVPFAVQWARARAVTVRMHTRSDLAPALHPADATTLERAAAHTLQFAEVNAETNAGAADAAFALHEQGARARGRKRLILTLKAGLVYAAALLIGGELDDAWQWQAFQGPACIAGFYFLVFPLLRWVYYRKQFNARDYTIGLRAEHPADMVARWLLGPDQEGKLFVFFTFLIVAPVFDTLDRGEPALPWLQTALCVAAALHGLAVVAHMRRSRHEPNVKLTVLRVFGEQRSAPLTFGGALRFWAHFGNWFTVEDPVLVTYRSRFWSRSTLGTIATLVVLWFVLAIFAGKVARQFGMELTAITALLGAALPAACLLPLLQYLRTLRAFAASPAAIESRIKRLLAWPLKLGGTYKAMPLPCFDNTWVEAVRQFVRHSDVVLMDLRGWSHANQGCAKEVDFLFDHISVDHILFLTDHSADLQRLKQLLIERWAYLHEDSPNCHLEHPRATLFAADDERAGSVSKQRRQQDMHGVVCRLLMMADKHKNEE
jgi:hypothetical protein